MKDIYVAPLVGAWIEILTLWSYSSPAPVAPLVGAWIEIDFSQQEPMVTAQSLLSWERGLKFHTCILVI